MKNLFPILMVISGGVLYHVSQKSVPKQVSPYAAIIIAYAAGIVCCLVAWLVTPSERALAESWRAANWSVWLLGIGAVMIEIGFLLAYRVGWNISQASVVMSISVALVLLPIGLLGFGEHISWRNAAGIVCCLLGLYLLSQK